MIDTVRYFVVINYKDKHYFYFGSSITCEWHDNIAETAVTTNLTMNRGKNS